jgi:hypothetical protein
MFNYERANVRSYGLWLGPGHIMEARTGGIFNSTEEAIHFMDDH